MTPAQYSRKKRRRLLFPCLMCSLISAALLQDRTRCNKLVVGQIKIPDPQRERGERRRELRGDGSQQVGRRGLD